MTNFLLLRPLALVNRNFTLCQDELTFPGFEPPLEVVTGQKVRVWYMEDLLNKYEVDNHGRLCVYVHVHFHS